MGTKIETGGPAFPRPASEDATNGTLVDGNRTVSEQDGMTLRDYFAAKAMAAHQVADAIICQGEDGPSLDKIPTIATKAYLIADAMLAARKATGSPAVEVLASTNPALEAGGL